MMTAMTAATATATPILSHLLVLLFIRFSPCPVYNKQSGATARSRIAVSWHMELYSAGIYFSMMAFTVPSSISSFSAPLIFSSSSVFSRATAMA